jgi:DNA-binding SARP family transcriptional activator
MRWTFLDGNSVTGQNGSVPLPSGALCTLAAVLVLNHDHPVSRDRLDDILWEGARPERARGRLNTMLWRLRKVVEAAGGDRGCFVNHHDYLMYSCDGKVESDALTITRLARALMRGRIADPEMVEDCLACIEACHTDFLPFAGDHWSIITRESLRSGLLMTIEALIAHMRAQSRWGRVNELVERMLAVDPALELGHQQLIEMHKEREDYGSALRHYNILTKLLKDNLATEPSHETAAAIDALRIAQSRENPAQRSSRRPALTMRPTIESVEAALDHIDEARDRLLSRSKHS